jgi:hypothetical protein
MEEFKGDCAEVAAAVEWVTSTISGDRSAEAARIVFQRRGSGLFVEGECGERSAGRQIDASGAVGETWMEAVELVAALAELGDRDGELVVTGEPEAVSLTVGMRTRRLRRVDEPVGEGERRVRQLVAVKTDAIRSAVADIRTLTGSGLVHVELSCTRLAVVGAHGRRRAVVPVELVMSGIAGEECFSFEGRALGAALRGLTDELTFVGVWLPLKGRGQRGAAIEREDVVGVSFGGARSLAVLPPAGAALPDYRDLMQSSRGWIVVDPALLQLAVAHAGALARADGEVWPVVELRLRGDEIVVVPVIGRVTRELDARPVAARLFTPMPERVRYGADDLATALSTLGGGPVTIRIAGPHRDATIVAYDGQFFDPHLARRSVAGVAMPTIA